MEDVLGLALNGLILILLAVTIAFAARLSMQLKALRDSKAELDKTVRSLITVSDKAQATIQGLRLSAQELGADMQERSDKARSLSDELSLMLESGEKLAARLEKLTDTLRPSVQELESKPLRTVAKPPVFDEVSPARKTDIPFIIRDQDAERGLDPVAEMSAQAQDDDLGLSAAERDLLRALQANRKRG